MRRRPPECTRGETGTRPERLPPSASPGDSAPRPPTNTLQANAAVTTCTGLTRHLTALTLNPRDRHTNNLAGDAPRAPRVRVGVDYPAMEEDPTEVNKNVRDTGRLTITEAAALLGVHPNTVRGRVKAGIYDAEKVYTENGFTWMINPDSLVNIPPPRASQQPSQQSVNPDYVAGATPMELVQDLLRPFVEDLGKVREELGAERILRKQAEQERDELHRRLESLQEMRDALKTGAEHDTGTETPASDTDQPRRSWWRRFFGFH